MISNHSSNALHFLTHFWTKPGQRSSLFCFTLKNRGLFIGPQNTPHCFAVENAQTLFRYSVQGWVLTIKNALRPDFALDIQWFDLQNAISMLNMKGCSKVFKPSVTKSLIYDIVQIFKKNIIKVSKYLFKIIHVSISKVEKVIPQAFENICYLLHIE